jgi:hypothetical protein
LSGTDFGENDLVGIMAEGKTHCLGIGLAKMSRDEMYEIFSISFPLYYFIS